MSLYDYGLGTLAQYELTADRSARTRGALLCYTAQGLLILREFHGSEKKLEKQQVRQGLFLLKLCIDFLKSLLTANGLYNIIKAVAMPLINSLAPSLSINFYICFGNLREV